MGPRSARTIQLCRVAILAFAAGLATAAPAGEVIKIGGTGTLLGTMRLLGDVYQKSNPDTTVVVVANLGSSGGIRALLDGAIDIAVNARVLTPHELERGATASVLGRTPFVFAVAAERAETAITEAELLEIFRGVRTRWSDGRVIRISLRPADDSDNEAIDALSPAMQQARASAHRRPGMFFAGSDQENADYLETIPGALGGIGLAVILSEHRKLRPLRLDGIEPGTASVAAGKYRLSKPLYLVLRGTPAPAARRFLSFVGSARGKEILRSVGVIPGSDAVGGR